MHNYIGIDIAKEKFMVARLNAKGKLETKEWAAATDADITAFIATLNKEQDHCVMEATGTYGSRLAYALATEGYMISVVNPLSVKRYGQMKNNIAKTDKADAILIQQYSAIEKPKQWTLPTESMDKLRQRRTLLNCLQKQSLMLSNQLEAITQHARPDEVTMGYIEDNICHLDEQITLLRAEITTILNNDYSDTFKNLQTIPGVGPTIAGALIDVANMFDGMDDKDAASKLAKHAGVAPSVHRSGKSVYKKGSTGRSGTPDLRGKMYMGAVSIACSTKKDNIFKAFYQKLCSNGKCHHVAIVAVIHKMIRIAVAVMQNNTPFSLEKYGKTA